MSFHVLILKVNRTYQGSELGVVDLGLLNDSRLERTSGKNVKNDMLRRFALEGVH